MTTVRTVAIAALYVALVGTGNDLEAQAPKPLSPQAAHQFASDAEKADRGDPEAAYHMGEAFESGRLAGVKDLKKALSFYRLAAGKGHQQAAERVAQIEAEMGQKKTEPPAASPRR